MCGLLAPGPLGDRTLPKATQRFYREAFPLGFFQILCQAAKYVYRHALRQPPPDSLLTDRSRYARRHRQSGPPAILDHQESYLHAVLGLLGITDITFVRAEGVSRKHLRDGFLK
jgi:hypothetical protein